MAADDGCAGGRTECVLGPLQLARMRTSGTRATTCLSWTAALGVDTMSYQPQTSTLNMNMRGTAYGFSSAGVYSGHGERTTSMRGTVNATTLNGAVSASQLPLFGASGSGHAPGAVPDPGAAAGATRYLREDGTWVTPPAGRWRSAGSQEWVSAALPVPARARTTLSGRLGHDA